MDRAERRALRAALGELGLPFSPRVLATYRAINAVVWEEFRRGAIDAATLSRERFGRFLAEMGEERGGAARLGRLYLQRLSERGDLLPGARRTLARLRRRYRLGLVTNGIDRVQRRRLKAARLAPFFGVVVTSEACGFAKPDPRILRVALDALDVAPAEAVYVGDDPRIDGGAAAAAGVAFWWLDGGAGLPADLARPARRVASLSELALLLDRA